MALSNDSLSIQTTFEYNNDPKNFEIVDQTDYAGEGVALADVVGVFKIIAPDGSIAYVNTDFGSPDIDADASLEFNTVSLPLDSEGNVQLGEYKITYTIEVSGSTQYTKEFVYNNQHVTPTASVTWDVDIKCSKITATDSTSYGAYVDTGGISRTFTLRPPAFSGLSDTVVSTTTVSATPITDQTWAAQVSSVVSYTYEDGLKVVDLVEGSSETDVDADTSLCDIYCGVKSVTDLYTSYRTSNPSEAERFKKEKIVPMLTYIALYERADACGKDDDKQRYYDLILETAGVTPGCSCEGDEPTLIVPTCGAAASGSTVVAVGGSGAITLSANVVGDTTTYTLDFDADLLSQLNALHTTTVTGGANTTVTPTATAGSGGTPDDIDYLIDVDLGDRPAMLLESWSYNVLTGALNKERSVIIGTHFKGATATAIGSSGTTEDVEFKIDDWFSSGSVDCNISVGLEWYARTSASELNTPPIIIQSLAENDSAPTFVDFKLWDLAYDYHSNHDPTAGGHKGAALINFTLTITAKQ